MPLGSLGCAHAAVDQPRRAVPGARELAPDGPCGLARDARRLDGARRELRVPRGHAADRGARAAAPAAALAAGRGAVRARPSLLGRGGRDRPRLPRARDGAGLARHRRAARRPDRADHVAPAGPRAAAVGAVRDRGPRVGARGGADEDPSRRDRRADGAEIMALLLDLTPDGREVPPPGGDDLADPPPSTLQMLGLGMLGLPSVPGADAEGAAEGDPEPRGHAVRRSSPGSARSRRSRARSCATACSART